MCWVLRRESRKRGMAGWWVGFRGATTEQRTKFYRRSNGAIVPSTELHTIGSEAYWKSRIGGRKKGEGGGGVELTPGLSRRDRRLSSTTDNYATPLITRYQVSVDEIKERDTPLDRENFFSFEMIRRTRYE